MGLLFEEDRALMKALSVFRGGFFMKDAEAVLGSTPGVTDGIGLLRDNSLLRCQVVNASMRFRILDTVREYLDRVAKPEELHSIREKHANHFSVEAARIRDLFNKGEYAQAREQLWLDIGNFRAAVQFSIQDGNQDVVCVFAGSLARVYFEAGAKDEFETLAIAAEGSASLNDRHLLIELHGLHGELCRRDNVPEKAKLHWRKRAQLCRELEDVEAEADSYLDIADLAMGLKDLTTVEEMLAAFGRLEGRLALGPVLASGVVIRAKTQLYRGQLADALESCRRVEEIMSAVQVDRQALFVWIALAQIYRSAGSPDDCIRLCSRLLSDALISGHYLSAGKALLELSNVYEQTGKASLAASSIVVACLIPRAVSSVLRDQCLKRKQELAKAIGPELLDLATSSCSQGDWQDHAWIHVRPEMSPATQ